MRIAVVLIAGCSGTEYAAHRQLGAADVEVVIDEDAGMCAVETADELMFCVLAVPAEEARLSCEVLGTTLAAPPATLEEQTDMAYGGLLHFGGEVTSWWIASEDEDGCTVQSRYGSWAPGVDCTETRPFICALTSSTGSP